MFQELDWQNAIGVIVGNGLFNINRERYRKIVIKYGNPMMIGQLRILFTDGTEQVLVSGDDWKIPSPTLPHNREGSLVQSVLRYFGKGYI
ncbi:MAG: alpha-L-rhamnosidase N-terminal domain-containing protein [Prolixibacteraceae bacterium]